MQKTERDALRELLAAKWPEQQDDTLRCAVEEVTAGLAKALDHCDALEDLVEAEINSHNETGKRALAYQDSSWKWKAAAEAAEAKLEALRALVTSPTMSHSYGVCDRVIAILNGEPVRPRPISRPEPCCGGVGCNICEPQGRG